MNRAILFCALGSFALGIGCGGSDASIGRTGTSGGGGTAASNSGSGGAAAGATSSGGSGGTAVAGAPSSGGSGTGGTTVNIFLDLIRTDSTTCLPRALPPPELGSDCHIFEATTDAASATCSLPARTAVSSEPVIGAARSRLEAGGFCGGAPMPDCTSFHVCEIEKADPSCLQATPSPDAVGWCYIDPDSGVGDPSLVATCPMSARRLIRFVGENTPLRGAVVMVACGSGF